MVLLGFAVAAFAVWRDDIAVNERAVETAARVVKGGEARAKQVSSAPSACRWRPGAWPGSTGDGALPA